MCENIDIAYINFAEAIAKLRRGPRTYDTVPGGTNPLYPEDPGYLARLAVCEKSRLAWFETDDALNNYSPEVLTDLGYILEPRHISVGHLFAEAIDLLSVQEDAFLENVTKRWNDLEPRIENQLAKAAA